jgi:hypothetical protein
MQLASDLRAAVGLRRAVETGTYRGDTARALATVFPAVVTIELSADLHRAATAALADVQSIRAVHGHSSQVLSDVRDPQTPTLFFLDGHWSGGATAGIEDECPVLEELEALAGGHPDDCLLIDDARLFASAPPPPHNPEMWPALVEVFDAIRLRWPEHLVTLLADQVIAVPPTGRAAVDAYGRRIGVPRVTTLARAQRMGSQVTDQIRRRIRRIARSGSAGAA